MDLKNKTVVIIGGTSGIGLATAVEAYERGAIVHAASRSKDKVEAKASEHPDINFFQQDIHDSLGLEKSFQALGEIDHVVAVATGANRKNAPFMEQSPEEFKEAFNKFWGYTNVARLSLPLIRQKGSLTFVSGFPARKCNVGMSSISATGCAVEGLSRALALEVAPIRVNVVAPGIIDTEAFDRLGEGKSTALENMGKNIPIGRVGRPEEVGLAILHAMENPYMTGATIDIDGGILLP